MHWDLCIWNDVEAGRTLSIPLVVVHEYVFNIKLIF